MRSPEQCLHVPLVKLIEHICAIRLAPVLLIHHMKACRSIRINLSDLGLDALVAHRTIRISEQLDRLTKDLNRVHIRLSIELDISVGSHHLVISGSAFVARKHVASMFCILDTIG